MKTSHPLTLSVGIGLAIMFAAAYHADAATVASDDFSSGTLSGGTGDWLTDWTTTGVSITPTATTFALDVNRSAGTANNTASVHRQYSGNLADAVQIAFDFTIDAFPTAGGNANQDRFEVVGDGTAAVTGSAGTNTWMVFGGENIAGLDGTLAGNTWTFHNGTGGGNFENGGGGENNLVDSGIDLVLGNTYRFSILDDPASGSYIASVDNLDDVAVGFTSGSLGYRGAAGSDPFMIFGTRLSTSGDTAEFTIDNVSLVPEPGTALLAVLGTLVLLARRRRA